MRAPGLHELPHCAIACKPRALTRRIGGVFKHALGLALALAIACVFAGATAHAQGTKADYERADGLQKLFANKVFKTTLKANWFANNTKFWYRNDLAGDAREFILVDEPARRAGIR